MWLPDVAHRYLLLLVVLGLTGCGFQLRGTGISQLQSVGVTGAGAAPATYRILKETLSRRDVAVVTPGADTLNVQLLDERSTRRSVATTDIFDAAEYELRLELDVAVFRGETILLPEATIVSERVYAVDAANLSASYEEQALLLAEMRADLADQLIRRIEILHQPQT